MHALESLEERFLNAVSRAHIYLASLLIAIALAGCAPSTKVERFTELPPNRASSLIGYHNLYTLVLAEWYFWILEVDESRVRPCIEAILAPGLHWIYTSRSAGIGIPGLIGLGNTEYFGFEFDFLPGRIYRLKDAPLTCSKPFMGRGTLRASRETIILDEYEGDRLIKEHKVSALCGFPVCRQNSDCFRDDSPMRCELYGVSGFGICTLREQP
jgi:hypothetical protein